MARIVLAFAVVYPGATAALAAPRPPAPSENHQITTSPDHQILERLVLEGASVYSRDDVLWLLGLREGAPLPKGAGEIATDLQNRYMRDGYAEARVAGTFDAGRLTLRVDEGRIDEIEFRGVDERQAPSMGDRLGVKPGDVYNKRTVGQAIERLLASTDGAIATGRPRTDQPGGSGPPSDVEQAVLEHRGGRNVLVIPLRWRRSRVNVEVGARGREDLFSPVDGLSPALGFTATIFDHRKFNHTLVDGYAEYKLGRDNAGYSLGLERPLFGGPRLFVGAEVHDISASDDLWRISNAEQTLVALGFKNTFRDYYRRRGVQLFGALHAGPNNEFAAMARWDRHEPLENSTNYSFFRDDAAFRANAPVTGEHVNAWILGYTFDTRPMTGTGQRITYQRHLHENLIGFGLRQQPGLRLEWTSEIAGHGLGGDARFARHIVNTRGYLALSERQLLVGRAILGGSTGALPIERQFALGGVGTVHGYGFKEASGTGMALFNAEYRVTLARGRHDHDWLDAFAFYDAGRVSDSIRGSGDEWLQGIGVGVGIVGIRVEFGFRANDIPRSRQVLVRLGPTF